MGCRTENLDKISRFAGHGGKWTGFQDLAGQGAGTQLGAIWTGFQDLQD